MTEEEKETIEILKEQINFYDSINIKDTNSHKLMNLIEKLQKENEELKKEKVTYLNKVYDKIDNYKYEYKKAEMHYEPEIASFYRDLIRHFEKLLEEG